MTNFTTHGSSGGMKRTEKAILVKKSDIYWAYYLLVMATIAYFVSHFLLSYYIYGDQIFYTRFYDSLSSASLLDVPFLQMANTGSVEPLFGLFIWIGANMGLEKVVYISLVNVFFVVVTGLALRKLGASIFIATLVFSNYYFLVMFTSAERLKFSFIFLAMVFITSGKLKTIFFLMAPLAHFQTVINYASWFSGLASEAKLSYFKKKSFLIKLAIYLLVAAFAGNYILSNYGDAFVSKFEYYFSVSSFDFAQLAKILLLVVMGFLLGIRPMALFFYLLPILVAAALLGPERVNMIGFTMFLFLVAKHKKLGHPYFLAILFYLSYKSINYVDNIVNFGTGYPQ